MSTQVENQTKPAILTRTQYIREKSVSHEDYYAQFVTEQTLQRVEGAFGVERLSEALEEDQHLNTIPLRQWDLISFLELDEPARRGLGSYGAFRTLLPFDREAAAAAHEGVTRATLICIAKRAARMLVEQHASRSAAVPRALAHAA